MKLTSIQQDYQALMPRAGPDAGYEALPVCVLVSFLNPSFTSSSLGTASCGYCMDMLTSEYNQAILLTRNAWFVNLVTASSKNKLRAIPLARLRAYMNAYNVGTGSVAVEKDDLVEAIMRARVGHLDNTLVNSQLMIMWLQGPNGCLLSVHEVRLGCCYRSIF